MKGILYRLHLGWGLFWFAVLCVVLTPFIILPYLIFGTVTGGRISYFFVKVWALGFQFPMTTHYNTTLNSKVVKKGQAYIYICNHNSLLDSPTAINAIPYVVKPLGKIEFSRIPIFGLVYTYMVILVDRASDASRAQSMRRMKILLENGISVLIFPEGRMNVTANVLQPFYDGAFRLAIETQTSILPLVIAGSKKVLSAAPGLNLRYGKITAQFQSPIATQGLTMQDIPALKAQATDVFLNALTELNKR